jgi:hypothetical protein
MNRMILATAVLALCGSSIAQSWSPLPKYQSAAGKAYQYYFGRYSNGRWQFADGNFRNTALVVTKVSMRRSSTRTYSDTYRMGRSWTNVNIAISPTDLTSLTSNFSNNQTSTPTQCYSGAMSWPTVPVGLHANSQNVYTIQAPLTTPYINSGSGSDDMLIDYKFRGGTLANNGVWASRTTKWYYTDGYQVTSVISGPQRFFHDTTTAGCVDSAARPLFSRSYTYQWIFRYSSAYRTTSFRNRLRLYNYTYNVGPSSPFMNVVDLAVNPAGIPFGAGCEKLYLGVTPAALFYPGSASISGFGGQNLMGFPNGLVPFNPAFLGLELYTQSTWDDTVSKQTKLSAASSAKVPALGIESNAQAKRNSVYHFDNASPTGFVNINWWANPIIKYN